MLQLSDVASTLADENLSMNNSDAVVQAASLGAHLAATIHQRALEEAPRSDVVDGLAAEAVAQTGTAGFGACAAAGCFVLTARAGAAGDHGRHSVGGADMTTYTSSGPMEQCDRKQVESWEDFVERYIQRHNMRAAMQIRCQDGLDGKDQRESRT